MLVQEPASAKFDAMPRSAIDAGLADLTGLPEELPGKIMTFLRHTSLIARPESALLDKTQSALSKVVILLRAHTGHDFSLYKKNTFYRRIERRMSIHQIDKIDSYIRYLQENSQELDLLFKELLIGVTNFFRDPAAWDQLGRQAIPELLAKRSPGQALRAWVAGCSSGEEAYSLAMLFKEAVNEIPPKGRFTLHIFATDLDHDAIDKARQGFYPDNIAADVSPERLARFFSREDHGYRVRREIREMVTFAPQNLIMDPPFTKLDLLSCRNLLIYLAPEMQKKLFPLFYYSLNPGGILFLGSAETIGTFTELFTPLCGKSRLFWRSESALGAELVEFPSSFSTLSPGGPEMRRDPKPSPSLQTLADQLVLQRYAPPAVLVNEKGDIFYISGRTGKYIEPAAGKANWNIFAMAREGIRYELTGIFQKALREKGPATLRSLKLGNDGAGQFVDVTVQRLDEAGPLQGLMMIVFADVAAPMEETKVGRVSSRASPRTPRLEKLERELQGAHEEARSTREEMQTSQEELRSTNEEMQSANEELQSTNEELTTSKEEMQSMNEELQILNAELQTKLDELSRSNNDMKNLLNSTDIATVFLDSDLKVRRFTTQVNKIMKLIPGDVGRPITDLASELSYQELAEDARQVLQTLVPAEKPIGAKDGRWFTVRIMPYRTLDNRIDGLVITFADITTAKTLEAQLRGQQASLEKRFQAQSVKSAKPGKKPRTVSDP